MPSYNVSGGNTVTATTVNVTGVNFGNGGGTFHFAQNGAQNTYNQPITGFGPGDHLVGQTTNFIGGTARPATIHVTPNGDGSYTIILNDPQSTTTVKYTNVRLDPGVNPNSLTAIITAPSAGSEFQINGCFLIGTLIETAAGEVAVEYLSIGDKVVAYAGETSVHREVVWIGKRGYTVNPALPVADAGYPVRVVKDAFAAGVPHKDMLITPEHCVFVEGKLVPVRMLVNGRSVFYDTSISAFDFYHVETVEHSILRSDGALTESYLDTGNRGVFANAPVPSLRPELGLDASHKSWEHDAAAPLAVDRETVEPIWHMLAERAGVALEEKTLVDDPDLRLVTESGLTIRPAARNDGTYGFAIPAGVAAVRLVSRTSRPAEIVGPFLDDRRDLGVLVGKISLMADGGPSIAVSEHLSAPKLAGWYGLEMEGVSFRWTKGNATLSLPQAAVTGRPMYLEIEVSPAAGYLVETAAAQQAIAA